MDISEIVGFLASALVFATFYMKAMTPLRVVAIASNVAFISYGYLGGMIPILILHVALLPLNVWRLWQTRHVAKAPIGYEGGIRDQTPSGAVAHTSASGIGGGAC